jgi:very-long-chain (3R)-3-hydroxyacyl-CoA dehydratase
VASRLIVLWGIVHLAPPAQVSLAFPLMAVAWSLVEVPRYGFYLCSLLATPPAWLTWLRYSLFLVLYPSGITGEMGCLWASLPYFKASGVGEWALPNPHNLVFTWHGALWVVLTLVYPPGSYIMFTHMQKQRAKVLGGGGADAKAKAAAGKKTE